MIDSLITVLRTLFKRDLEKLKTEITAYQDEEKLWQIEKNIINSAGNLCLHLVGNLNTYIGAELGQSGYVRQRDLEFSSKNVPRSQLIQQIEDTMTVVDKVLLTLTTAQLKAEYPLLVWEEKTTTEYLLVHLTTHLTYHLGQINYQRRLLDVN